jgi:peptide/nickel transport system substrate-binding protein
MPILDPEEGGTFGVGSNGTGAFELVEFDIGEKAVLRARKNYWGDGLNLEELWFVDLGDDSSAVIAALGLKQVHGLVLADPTHYATLKKFPHVDL